MPRTVMIADGDREFRRWARDVLKGEGYDVVEATGGRVALVLGPDSGADLFLIDVMLAGVLGTEVCAMFREDQRTAETPVVFLCSSAEALRDVRIIEVANHRAEECLRKPITEETLVRVAGVWVEKGRQLQEPPTASKRQRPRIRTDLEAKVLPIGDERDPFEAQVISLSAAGGFVLSEKRIPVGEILSLSLQFPDSREVMLLEARVLYHVEGAEGGMGVAFADLSETGALRIQEYIDFMRRVVR